MAVASLNNSNTRAQIYGIVLYYYVTLYFDQKVHHGEWQVPELEKNFFALYKGLIIP